MGTTQDMQFCKHCDKMTMHIRPATSHILHLLLSVVTMGIWVPVWLLIGISNSMEKGKCSVCGCGHGMLS